MIVLNKRKNQVTIISYFSRHPKLLLFPCFPKHFELNSLRVGAFTVFDLKELHSDLRIDCSRRLGALLNAYCLCNSPRYSALAGERKLSAPARASSGDSRRQEPRSPISGGGRRGVGQFPQGEREKALEAVRAVTQPKVCGFDLSKIPQLNCLHMSLNHLQL